MSERIAEGLEWVHRHPWLTAIALALLARIAFLSGTGLSLDDLKYFDSVPPKEFLLSQGRFGWLLADRLFHLLGMSGPYWYVHATLFGCALVACAGVVYARLALLDADARCTTAAVAAGVLFAIHPFHAEALTFREAFPFYALAIACGAAGLVVLERGHGRWWRLAAGTLLITLAISVYQLVLNVIAVVLLFRMICELGSGVGVRQLARRGPLRAMLAGTLIGTLAFLLIMKLLVMALAIGLDSRAEPVPLAELPRRMHELLVTVGALFRFEMPVRAPLLAALLMSLAAVGCLRTVLAGATWSARIAILLLLLLVPFAAIGVVGAGGVYWPAPRTLVGFAFATGMLLALATRRPAPSFAGPALAALTVVYASFCVIGDTVALDQTRVNARDRHTAAMIDARVGGLGLARVAFVGNWTHGTNVRTRVGDMSLSAFAIGWARAPALTEYTGRAWNVVDASGRVDWADRCAALPKWPHADAVFVDVEIAVLCL